ADRGVALIQETEQALSEIVSAVEHTDQDVRAISAAVTGLLDGLNAIASRMDSISAVAEESAAGAQETSAAAQEQRGLIAQVSDGAVDLASMAHDLHDLVDLLGTGSAEEARVPALRP
ncbi:MAG: hypothetical protein H7338_09725, partial [Candidatus Sericytochromatia bacterium]|nr:hypothetical protein [Candidatus Sericytochromatia bacterium]